MKSQTKSPVCLSLFIKLKTTNTGDCYLSAQTQRYVLKVCKFIIITLESKVNNTHTQKFYESIESCLSERVFSVVLDRWMHDYRISCLAHVLMNVRMGLF